ncbi:unnamed protein product, partial [Rotaria sp. Silwood1]
RVRAGVYKAVHLGYITNRNVQDGWSTIPHWRCLNSLSVPSYKEYVATVEISLKNIK